VSATAESIARPRRALEWQTWAVAVAVYAGFGLLTWYYHALPFWLVLPAGAFLVAWHGSLQHEVVHHHPTRSRSVNEALVLPSLWLWMPYRVYRDTHLAHHRDERITDPFDDPESYYITANQWARCGFLARTVLRFRNTLLGRLLVGPAVAMYSVWRDQLPRLVRGEARALRTWGLHALGCALVLAWTIGVCGISFAEYVALIAYPGISLTLLRSFAEHRAEEDPADRSVIVEASWPLALLFLNNNLHALHHAEPGVPWYDLPRRYRAERDRILAANGDYRFAGYGEIVRRYFFRPKEDLVHPAYRPVEEEHVGNVPYRAER